jgi:uncharacterized protein
MGLTQKLNLISFSELHRDCLDLVVSRIRDHYATRLVTLAIFGSYARGEPRLGSDLDLLLVLASADGPGRSSRTEDFVHHVEQPCDQQLQKLFEEGISMELSPLILVREEARNFNPLYLDMATSCRILEDRDGFFEGVLNQVRRQMSRWGSERMDVGGRWLWEIRPGLKWNEVLRYDQ